MSNKPETSMVTGQFMRAARLAELRAGGCLAVHVQGHALALFAFGDKVYAVDNRCPHMGFPLDRGTVKEGILTCHWHHARFDLESGGTFDPWADDVRVFPVKVRDGEIWVNLEPSADIRTLQQQRLRDGLERNLSLLIAKAVVSLLDSGEDPAEPFRAAIEFGTRYREAGWGQGLTMLTCFANLLPQLEPDDRPRGLYHGLSAVAAESSGAAPRFPLRPLPSAPVSLDRLKQWFRQFVEVRDAEGAERCLVSAVRAGACAREMAEMLFAAATDHRYIQTGHVLDFTNKALEALDRAGWWFADMALASLARGYAEADRMEESNAWRKPVDLVAILERRFEALTETLAAGRSRRASAAREEEFRDRLVPVILGDDPSAIAEALMEALREGCSAPGLAGAVAYAAALRIAHFHTSNEFGDWDTALHTFTFANAVHQGLLLAPSAELVRGAFDAAMSVYLDRFLNVPPAPLPEPLASVRDPQELLGGFGALLDRQQQTNEAGDMVAAYFRLGGDPGRLLAALGRALLREDRNFHTIQMIEAAFRQYVLLGRTTAGINVLVAAARYLAAHSPTLRAQGQTYQIARRLHRGERLFEG